MTRKTSHPLLYGNPAIMHASIRFLASDQLLHRVIQMDGDGSILADIRLKGLLKADTLLLLLADINLIPSVH